MGNCLIWIRLGAVLAAAMAVAGCYTSETPVLTADNAQPFEGISEGVYCHAENRLTPPQVTAAPAISEALGDNKCRDLHWVGERGQYVDRLSESMVLRTGPTQLAELSLLQTQTGEAALARFMPVAVVDGMFILFDPAGEWPAGPLEASGLELREDGALASADPAAVRALIEAVWPGVLDRFREDLAFVEDAAGPRLEFRRVDTAYSYLVYFREDWSGDTERMRGAMVAIADALGLGKYDATWTEHPE